MSGAHTYRLNIESRHHNRERKVTSRPNREAPKSEGHTTDIPQIYSAHSQSANPLSREEKPSPAEMKVWLNLDLRCEIKSYAFDSLRWKKKWKVAMYQLSKVFAHGSFLTFVYPDGTEQHILKRWWPHTRQHDKAPKIWLKVGTTYERNSREHERQVDRIVGNHSYEYAELCLSVSTPEGRRCSGLRNELHGRTYNNKRGNNLTWFLSSNFFTSMNGE